MSENAKSLIDNFTKAKKSKNPGLQIKNNILNVQERRINELTQHFKINAVAVLADPVGSGKTLVSLCAAHLLIQENIVKRVVFIAPNIAVKDKWENENYNIKDCKNFKFISRSGIESFDVKSNTLFVIDEAHRGFQKNTGEHYKSLHDKICRKKLFGSKFLHVTATPMQLSAQGLVHMLSLGQNHESSNPWKEFTDLGLQLKDTFSAARSQYLNEGRDPEISTKVREKARNAGQALARAEEAYKKCFLLPAYPRKEAGIPDPPTVNQTKISLEEPWATAYHVARIIPELIGTGGGDMFHRRLVSSSQAFFEGKTGKEFQNLKDCSEEISEIMGLYKKIQKSLEDHPKIKLIIDWCRDSVGKDRNILIFCVFRETQNQLEDQFYQLGEDVFAPESSATLSLKKHEDWIEEFKKKPSDKNHKNRKILIVRDNLSESVDFDGGEPCLIHYDLAWNPVRLQQRYGRVVRASSGFTPVKPEDIFIPYLDVEVDRRLAETLHGRSGMADLLLPTETDLHDPNAPEGNEGEEADDHIWSINPEVLKIIREEAQKEHH